jgi:hypothetical protein
MEMTTLREAAQAALDALKDAYKHTGFRYAAEDELESALAAEQAQEPVRDIPCGPIGYATWEEYRKANPASEDWYAAVARHSEAHIKRLAAENAKLANPAPAQTPMTDAEALELWERNVAGPTESLIERLIRAVERHHSILGGGK